jgi:hypothetical protein
MKTITQDQAKIDLELHKQWLDDPRTGKRLDWSGCDCRKLDLSSADLSSADLSSAVLRSADLRSADLRSADLRYADLRYADLRYAVLRSAVLSSADLRYADLRSADLRYADLSSADLRYADLRYADLRYADLRYADLRYATGNMREIKSAQFDTWPITWTCAPDGITTLQIGCQCHPLETWKSATPEWINRMSLNATEWWAKYGRIVIELVEASPAVPWGQPVKTEEVVEVAA